MSEDDIIKMQADAGRNPDDWTGIEKALLAELIAARAEVEEAKVCLSGSRQTVEDLRAENAQQAAEIERLKQCLKAANANHEKFERLWYLEQDKNAQQAAEIRRLTGLLNGNPEEEA